MAQAGERRVQIALEQLGRDLADLPEHLGEGEVGHRGLAEVEAVTHERAPALAGEPVEGLAQQPGLADSGVPGEEDHPSRVGPWGLAGKARGTQQDLELPVTSDEALGPAAVHAHIGIIAHGGRYAATNGVRHERRAPLASGDAGPRHGCASPRT